MSDPLEDRVDKSRLVKAVTGLDDVGSTAD